MDFTERYGCVFSKDEREMRGSLLYSSGELSRVRDVVSRLSEDSECIVIAVNPPRHSVMLHDGSISDVSNLILIRRHMYRK